VPGLTHYAVTEQVATITLDDGKVNALSVDLLAELAGRLDQAEAEAGAVVLTGRQETLSAGFDLRCEPEGWPEMLEAGARVAERMLCFPRPLVAACNGNAVAMGAFLLLAADHRIGAEGAFRIGLNEVAIGLTMPWFGLALARHRLVAPAFDRCTVTGVMLDPDAARDAGFLDAVVPPSELMDTAYASAQQLLALNADAHRATKLRARERALAELRDGIERIADPAREI
jgi:enoyl-CoA hydratase/carnithine racemase